MNHGFAHCADYDKSICPKSCFRARLTEDVSNMKEQLKYIPLTYVHFKNTQYCEITEKEKEK